MSTTDIGAVNARRLQTPGAQGWARSLDPADPDRYLTITVDAHVSEPADLWRLGGLPEEYLPRTPRITVDEEGRQFIIVEGRERPQLIKGRPKGTEYEAQYEREGLNTGGMMWSEKMEPDDLLRMRAAATAIADEPSLGRIKADMYRDGVDAAIVFANRSQNMFLTPDHVFAHAMAHAWNVWALHTYQPHKDQFIAAAQLPMGDVDLAVREIEWAAEQGFKAFNIPCAVPRAGDPVGYNHPMYDRVWAALEASGLPVCMHVATGKDPRAATGSGGAVINKAVGFVQGTMEPLAHLLASGVFARFPGLRFVTVEADVGWVPWFLEALDLAYYKHHMWVRPHMEEPPSHYWYTNCWGSLLEDNVGLYLARDYNMIDRIMWSNDYPHHEGTWPHSKEAIERQLGGLREDERAKLLGLNAAALFGFDADRLLELRATPPDPAAATTLSFA